MMRKGVLALAVLTMAAVLLPTVASAQGASSIEGFGGVTLNALQSQPVSLGGTVAWGVTPAIQFVGEAGRIGNVMPALANSIFSVTQSELRASAFYAEGGVRLLAAPSSAVTPYGEATAGIARLDVSSGRFGSIGNAAASLGLDLIGRNAPVAGLGAGLLVRTGPILFDAGYRYKQLFPNQVLRDALGLGEPLRAHEVRAGIGVRF